MCEIADSFTFCPICQIPLKAVNILPDLHVSQCISTTEDITREECPRGVHCLSADLFHYRDFSHKSLAAYRASADFVPPDVDKQPTPKKRKSTPTRSPRKQKTPTKVNLVRNIVVSESDSDCESIIPRKKARKKLPFSEKTHYSKNKVVIKSSAGTKTSSHEEKEAVNLNSTISTAIIECPKTQKSSLPCTSSMKSSCSNTVEECCETEANLISNQIEITKPISFKRGLDQKCNKKRSDVSMEVVKPMISVKDPNQTCSTNLSQDPCNRHKNIKNSKTIAATVELDQDFKEKSLATNGFSCTEDQSLLNSVNLNSTEKVRTTVLPESSNANKNLLSDTESPKANNVDYLKHADKVSKSPVCVIKRIEFDDFTSGGPIDKSEQLQSKSNSEHSYTDFDDIIPGSKLDKELLQTLKRETSKSPTTTLNSCSSDYNASASVSSETVDSSAEEEGEEVKDIEIPSSPEVVIPVQNSRKANLFLSSSSDSDLPLASLVKNKKNRPTSNVNKEENKDINIAGNNKSGRVLRSVKKCPLYSNLSTSGSDVNSRTGQDSDSGKSTGSKISTSSVVKGKEVAGKILRTPKKAPIYLNGQSLKTELKSKMNGFSDKDSDSGKSSGSKDSSSFVPSDKETSSQPTDSAFSAESSDNLVSSTSTTVTSSENSSCGSRSTDLSFTGESDSSNSVSKTRRTKAIRKSPQQYRHFPKTLSEEGSSSDISQKEKLLFGRSKKSSTPKRENDSGPIQPIENIYAACQVKAKQEWQSVLSKMRSSCFPSDLKIDSEDSLTVASSCSSSDTSRSSITLPSRQCPFYKRIPDTPFAVDAFQYWNIPGVRAYFLSHFHSDHYIGLKKSFASPIYCSQITANLVRMQLRVDEKWLRVLELNEPQVICGVEVTALDANHCPGSMMFLFSLNNGQNYLHVGDFRASKAMTHYPCLQRTTISKLFLDTTYCSPQYCFPTQEEVIGKVIDIVKEQVKTKPRTLVVCGSYTIGKEKVFLGIAEALNWKVWARPNKQRVFSCLNDKRINSRLSQDPRTANVHVLPMANIQIMPLQQHLQSCSGTFTHVLGFKPTGWELTGKTQDFKVTSRDNITIYGVPYSEHSSFTELRDFVCFLEPREVVPTVNVGSAASRSKMNKHFSDWLRPKASGTQPTKAQSKVSQYFTKATAS